MLKDYDWERAIEDGITESLMLLKQDRRREAETILMEMLEHTPNDLKEATHSEIRAKLETQAYDLLQDALGNLLRRDYEERIMVFGDASVASFHYVSRSRQMFPYFVECNQLNSEMLPLLSRPTTDEDFKKQLTETLSKYKKPHVMTCFCIGEMTDEFISWLEREKYGVPLAAQMEEAVHQTDIMLKEARRFGWQNVTLCGVSLPRVIPTGFSRKALTEITLAFNQQLLTLCQKNEFHYIDITAETINPFSGEVDATFCDSDLLDDFSYVAWVGHFWSDKIRKVLSMIEEQEGTLFFN